MRKIWENKAKSFEDAEDFNIKFWNKAGTDVKFSAMWEMIREFYNMRGKHGYKLRLQRSIQNIEHRKERANIFKEKSK